MLDRRLTMPEKARLWQTAQQLFLYDADSVTQAQVSHYQSLGAQCVPVLAHTGFSWQSVATHLGEMGLHHVW